jgi:hypothetical protein
MGYPRNISFPLSLVLFPTSRLLKINLSDLDVASFTDVKLV